MAEVYNALGEDIIVNSIIRASDVNEILTYIQREMTRRGVSYSSNPYGNSQMTAGTKISITPVKSIDWDCRQVGYSTSETFNTMSAAQMKRYAAFIKDLYGKIIVT
jgi:hypothetical protein